MKVGLKGETLGSLQAKDRYQVLLFFYCQTVPVFTAKLLYGFCNRIILTKTTVRIPSCKSSVIVHNTKDTSLSVTFTGVPEMTT
jgi:hypothetical protein